MQIGGYLYVKLILLYLKLILLYLKLVLLYLKLILLYLKLILLYLKLILYIYSDDECGSDLNYDVLADIEDVDDDDQEEKRDVPIDTSKYAAGPPDDISGSGKVEWYTKRMSELEAKLETLEREFREVEGIKDYEAMLRKVGVSEISYRDMDMSGTHALKLLNNCDPWIDLVYKYNYEIGLILECLLVFTRFLVHSCCHKNRVRYTDKFIFFFKCCVIIFDHIYHVFLIKCNFFGVKKVGVGQKVHMFIHVLWWMEYYRFSPAWFDDQKAENVMKLLKRMFRKMAFSLNRKKLRSMVHKINLYHQLRFDMSDFN